MLINKSMSIRTKTLTFGIRFRHKINKANDEIKDQNHPKIAQDVLNFLQQNTDYKELIDIIPKSLLRKYKTPETMYLIDKKTAKVICDTVKSYLDNDAPIVEVNPGFGFLTEEILQCQHNSVYLYENAKYFSPHLRELQKKYPGRVNYKIADFFGMWKLAFQDKMDQGNRIQDLLGDLASENYGRKLKILGAMPGLSFVKHLINTIVFHDTTNEIGRPDLFIIIPGHHYQFLTDTSIQQGKHRTVPSLFQMLFKYEIITKVPKVQFLPWTLQQSNRKISLMDEHFLYLVNITQKEDLPCPQAYLPLLWYFFKPQTFSKHTRVIPMLEQWIPGCGVWLITGQDPPETNREIASGNEVPLPHMTIFTEYGELTLQQKLTLFKRFVSWPEFEHCPFRSTMENNLPKFATQLADEDDDKTGTHFEEIEHSDSETEP